MSAGAYDPAGASDVEAGVEHVAVLADVGLPSQPLLAGTRRLRMSAGGDEVVPAHDLAADEAARDVGVNGRGSVDRGAASSQRPRTRLLLPGGEERDEVEGLRQPAHDAGE